MNFGVRLPGPFRVGISSSGRVNAGVTAGPFSVSTDVGQAKGRQREMFVPDTRLADLVAAAIREGWKVQGQGNGWAMVGRGFTSLHLQTEQDGVLARRVTSRRTLIALGVGILAMFALCALAGCGPKSEPATGETVRSGAYCQQAGASAQTDKGRPMVCATTDADAKLRWRAR